jgi:hypothetical protein
MPSANRAGQHHKTQHHFAFKVLPGLGE